MTAAAHGLLAREFAWMLTAVGGKMVESTVNLWASGPLSGARHAFTFDCAERLPPACIQRMARELETREFGLELGFVADAYLVSSDGALSLGNQVRIEALTLSG